MTEAEWQAGTNPYALLYFLRDKVSDRKLRLFACACYRVAWHLEEGRQAPDAAEALAVAREAERMADEGPTPAERTAPLRTGGAVLWDVAHKQPNVLAEDMLEEAEMTLSANSQAAERLLTGLLRDIVGNPFRPAAVAAAWLAWQGGVVPQLARSIRDARRFADLPVLADALEETGCTDAALLDHCRQPGEHAFGCWVLDLLVGKA